ncbi:MAG: DUF2155 domain-containing protein [Rubrimonas sp.]
MTPRLSLAAALMALAVPAAAETGAPYAVLRGLDKFSGLTRDFHAAVGEQTAYERLLVTPVSCRDRENGDYAAFLDVRDAREPEVIIFRGWMFATNPSVSALDHPRYDVWVLSCSTSAAEAS